jgi:hypothetical protein
MTRVSMCIAALAAAVAAGCSGSEGAATPTAPSSSTSSGGTASPQASCTMPTAPANLHVDSVQGTTVSLSWSAVSGATEYLVLVGSTSGSSDELFTNTSQTNYTYGGVKQGHHYARVQAKNACGTSGSSNSVDYTISG